MSAAPKKVFILENDEYVEITNEEHCQRKEHDRQYSKKYFIFVNDYLMEVTYENYKSYHKFNEHKKYVTKRDKKKGVILVPEMPGFFKLKTAVNLSDGIDQREIQECIKKVFEVLALLDKKDQEIIRAIYFEGLSEHKLAKRLGISQPAVHKKKVRILKKMKSLIELIYE